MSPRILLALALCAAAPAVTHAATGVVADTPSPPRIVDAELDSGELRIEFDQPMITWAGETASAIARFVPASSCVWYWEDDTTLACQTDRYDEAKRFRPATPYRITVARGLWSQAGVEAEAVTLDLVASRPALDARVDDWHDGLPRIALQSALPLTPADISSVLDVTLDGQSLSYALEPFSAAQRERQGWRGDQAMYYLVPVAWPRQAGSLRLQLREGLRSPAGPARGEARRLLDLQVNEPLRLRAASCGYYSDPAAIEPGATKPPPLRCQAASRVTLVFSGRLADGEAARLEAALPGLRLVDGNTEQRCDYRCASRGVAWLPLEFETDLAGAALPLALPADLRSDDGRVLKTEAMLVLNFDDLPTAIRAEPTTRLLRSGSEASLALELRNLTTPRLVAELAVGGRSTRSDTPLPAVPQDNKFHPWRSKPRGDLASDGGLLLAGVRDRATEGFAVAVAPFNVIASEDSRRVLVWATDWTTGAAIADAKVELFEVDAQGDQTSLARGRTGADGVVYLPRPTALADEREVPRLVRVSHRGRQSVMPVINTWSRLSVASIPEPDDESGGWGSSYSDDDTLAFGVSDRLLYRPGDTAHYRVWLRQRNGNRLIQVPGTAAPLKFQLIAMDGDEPVQEWEATQDRWGGMEGSVPLSAKLADGDYCITLSDLEYSYYELSGACFRVSRFDAQPVFVQASFDRALARPGKPLALEIEGGFYSGGSAAGAGLEVNSYFQHAAFAAVYPTFAGFEFVSDRSEVDRVAPLSGFAPEQVLDGKGRATIAGELPAELRDDDDKEALVFGRITARAGLNVPGQPSSYSPRASVVYAGRDRYTGLRAEGGWLLSSKADPVLEAVVATAEGEALPGARIAVRIETLEVEDGEEAPAVLARCELRAGEPTPCPFRAPKPGQYRFVADSEGAASAEFTRYFYASDAPAPRDEMQVTLSVETPTDGRSDAVLWLQQPHVRASALFVVEYGDIKQHWVQAVGPDTRVTVPVKARWAPAVSVRVLLRPDVAESGADPLKLATLGAVVRLDVPPPAALPVTVAMDESRSAPGAERVIRLHNPGKSARLVTLAVVDDSVHQQAAQLHANINPQDARWLGRLKIWSGATWYGFGEWRDPPNLFWQREPAAMEGEPSPAAAPEESSTSLDTIEVTGSRIRRADVEAFMPVAIISPPPEATTDGRPAARVRSRFPVTAYWNPGEVLEPGESREIRFTLPDNLTRWRLLAWASDERDAFALDESTLEASLPLEIRAGVPGRLFDGDQGSGTVTVRANSDQGADVSLQVSTDGAGTDGVVSTQGKVAAQASLPLRVPLRPTAAGEVALLARASTATDSDALSSVVTVQTRVTDAEITQAGWLESGPLALGRPDLPRGAMSPVLHLTVARGTDPWRDGWLQSLRDYPHRCWEQTLSRGVGAAFALASRDTATAWPQAQTVLDEMLRDAQFFRDQDGHFRYFIAAENRVAQGIDPVLSAYTLRGFQWLEALGHEVPGDLHEALIDDLAQYVRSDADKELARKYGRVESIALAAGALAADGKPVPSAKLQAVWQRWDDLSWYGRSELVRAMAADDALSELSAQGLQRLREAGRVKGMRRILDDGRDFGFLMGSPLRDQCAIVATLWTLDKTEQHRPAREQWLRGLLDLYAGGAGSLDSQSSAQCLVALQAAGAGTNDVRDGDTSVAATVGALTEPLTLRPGAVRTEWVTPFPAGAALGLAAEGASDGTLNYSAQVRYRFDQRNAVAQGIGMQLQRSYQVLRNRAWVELGDGAVTEGDWIRTKLTVVVPAMRHFVAITDVVPGGLVTKDVRLGGVAGDDVQRLADEGSWWFDTRQTGASEVRFYAQQLPPGTHELHYYTQATHAGRYFAPPAVAELMYGRNSRANTGPRDLHVRPRD